MADSSTRPIGSTFITIDRKSIFDGLLAAGYIKDTSVVLIEDTALLWIHGTYVGGVNAGNYITFGTANTNYVPVTVSGTDVYNLSLNSHTHQYITGSKTVGETAYDYTLDAVSGGSLGGPLALKYIDTSSGYVQLLDFGNGSTLKLHDNTSTPTINQGLGFTFESRVVNGSPTDCSILDLYNEYGFRFHDLFEELSTYDSNFFTYNGYPILTSLNKDDYSANLTLSNVTPGSNAYINIMANPSATSYDDMGGVAQFAKSIISSLWVNGTEYNGGDDPVYIDCMDIDYGGTGKTIISRNSHTPNPNYIAGSTDEDTMNEYLQTDGWFVEGDLTSGTTINLLPYLTGTNNSGIYSANFNSIPIPSLDGASRYALINTATGLSWVNLGVFLEAAAAMVFKGTVNCSNDDELQTAKLNYPEDLVLQSLTGKEVPWFEVEVGWTYVVTDRKFELDCTENTYGSYGTVEVGDLLICMEKGYTAEDGTLHIAQWAVVQNKTSDTVTYGTPTITELAQATNGTEYDYVALSMGAVPDQIKYNTNFYIDDRGVMHGKFLGLVISDPGDPTVDYVGFTEDSLTLTFSSASGTDTSGLCQMLNGNNYALRITSSYGNLTYSSTNSTWEEGTGNHTDFYIYEISGTTVTLRTVSELNSMTTGLTKLISIVSIGKDDGEFYSSTNNILTISHTYDNITDYNTSLSFGDLISGKKTRSQMHSTIQGYLATEVQNNIASRTTFTLTKTDDGFTITSEDGYYLNKYVEESQPTELTGGSYYNPIYIDNDEVTHTTQIFLYNLMNQYTTAIATWGDTSRNTLYDSLYNTYLDDNGATVGYGKNLVIPVNGAKNLFAASGDTTSILPTGDQSGAIIQWSNSTNTTTYNLQLFGSYDNNIYFRAENGGSSQWGTWKKLVTSDSLSSLQTALSYYSEDTSYGAATIQAPNLVEIYLDTSVIKLESGDIKLIPYHGKAYYNDYEIATVNDLTNYLTISDYENDELTISTALNTLNTAISGKQNSLLFYSESTDPFQSQFLSAPYLISLSQSSTNRILVSNDLFIELQGTNSIYAYSPIIRLRTNFRSSDGEFETGKAYYNDYEIATINDLTNYVSTSQYQDDEFLISTAINDLNDRLSTIENKGTVYSSPLLSGTGSGLIMSSNTGIDYKVGDLNINVPRGTFYICEVAGNGTSAQWTYIGKLTT